METARPTKRLFAYILPILHLGACLTGMIGYVVPSLQYLGIVWAGVMLADLPVSAIAYVLAWMHGTAATVWIVIAGTLWWYLLGLGIDVLVNRFKRNPQHLSHLGSAEKQ